MGRDSDPGYVKGLLGYLSKVLMNGLERNSDIADDDPDDWELKFLMNLESLYLKLEFADLLPNPLVHVIFDDVRQSVQDWCETLRTAVEFEWLGSTDDETESNEYSVLCHDHATIDQHVIARHKWKHIHLCCECYNNMVNRDLRGEEITAEPNRNKVG